MSGGSLYQGRHPVIQFPSVCIWKDEQIDSYRPTWQSARLFICLAQRFVLPQIWSSFMTTPFPVKKVEAIMGFNFQGKAGDICVQLAPLGDHLIALPLQKEAVVLRHSEMHRPLLRIQKDTT